MESMQYALACVFRSERLLYRNIEMDSTSDKDFIFYNLQNDPVNYGLASIVTLKPACKSTFREEYKKMMEGQMLSVLIYLPTDKTGISTGDEENEKLEATPIGVLHLSKVGEAPGSVASLRRTMMGIQIANAHQHKGYGREAINWALEWSFGWAGMHRVDIGTSAFNERAAKLYESIGFVNEGRTREAFYMNRKWHDVINFGMLESEWEALRGRV